MIQIEDISEIPEAVWSKHSSKEFTLLPPEVREEMVRNSSPIKQVSLDGDVILICGVFRQTMLGMPYLWVLLAERFADAPVSVLKQLVRRLAKELPVAETFVEVGNKKADRLARLFSFLPADSTIIHGSKVYRSYRRA
jgi:hypothetical protein